MRKEIVESGEWRVESEQFSVSPNLPISKSPNLQIHEPVTSGQWPVASAALALSPLPSPLSPASRRRGVLLLLVLALLAMFGLIAVAFVLLTGQAQRSAKSIERMEQTSNPPQEVLQQAAMQVFRGSNNPASIVGAHSLLEDIYGNRFFTGQVQNATVIIVGGTPTVGQLIEITPDAPTATEIPRRGGCVLTITAVPNPAKQSLVGQSTHIVSIDPVSGVFQVVAFPDGTVPDANTQFTINGAPFSGTGFGYSPTSGDLDDTAEYGLMSHKWSVASTTGTAGHYPVALLPNLPLNVYSANQYNPPGGANEDYDAADFQNMLLAAQVPNGAAPGGIQTPPSLHRTALLRYWAASPDGLNIQDANLFIDGKFFADQWNGLAPADVSLMRQIMMRPIGKFNSWVTTNIDHPNFTGSNPNFNPFWDGVTPGEGQWDVDNDGDGAADSVWVDLGMPVRTTTDGRTYKPLFAILCVDLDGRLNLNAHGNEAHTDANYLANAISTITGGVPQFAGGGVPTARGQGFGPAEINLLQLLNNDPVIYRRLFTGIAGGLEGRYGVSQTAGVAGADPLDVNKWFEYAGNENAIQDFGKSRPLRYWWGFSSYNDYFLDSYGTPPDPIGVGVVGLDQAGRPLYVGMMYNGTDYIGFGSGTAENPYELNLGPNAARGLPSPTPATTPDNPFGVAELERLLRPFDSDAPKLPDRLARLTSATGLPGDSWLLTPGRRKSFTTESWDVPCVTARGGQIAMFVRALRARGVVDDATALAMLPQLLPPEMLAGLKMNINRPFGDARDNDGNNVVDESQPQESDNQYKPNGGSSVPMSYDPTYGYNAPLVGSVDSLQARQLEARYLYVLMCLTSDLTYLQGKLGTFPDVARYLAQWAVNVVDFKDHDSIMTPFDYDASFANPSVTPTGWSAPVGAAPRVWGCERPELLISETLAFHDRRTTDEDTDTTASGHKTTSAAPNNDTTFDQSYRPQGSLFVELYNPSSPMEPKSGDLYTGPGGNLELTKIATDSTGSKKSPVWRLVIAVPTTSDEQPDPDDPVAAQQPLAERVVYFVDQSNIDATVLTAMRVALPHIAPAAGEFFPTTPALTPIKPGGYALIGPGELSGPNPKRTYIGFREGQHSIDKLTRYIDLDPNAKTLPKPQLRVQNNNNSPRPAEPTAAQVNKPALLAIDSPRRLSVSEPVGGYAPMETALPGPTGQYAIPDDLPFDSQRADGGKVFQYNGTTSNYRVVYLQRLANPLVPFDANTNPYRTIDMSAIDVTAFNGVCNDATDPQLTTPPKPVTVLLTHFQSRQRGERNDQTDFNIWKQEPVAKSAADYKYLGDAPALSIPHYFNKGLKHSLGYLNQPFLTPSGAAGYVGDPTQPFPWLTWNNRPFVSPLELMMVPALRSSRLLTNAGASTTDANCNRYFRLLPSTGTPNAYDPSNGTLFLPNATPVICPTLANDKVPYPHLLNFFQSTASSVSGLAGSPQFHRILDYLGVPSPFVGTEIQANPADAQGNPGAHAFHPPFNNISTYREPGRINLNTIYNQDVFDGVKNGFPYPTIGGENIWTRFVRSRRGYDATPPTPQDHILASDKTSPTEFKRPFRSYGGGSLVPWTSTDREIDATLLRTDPAAPDRPLFDFNSTNAYDNTDRNPYFRYQGLERLGNLVTTRSNVYAVWITVGYFEVSPAPAGYDPAIYPDGYRLGRELGVDTGEIERHRGFYIFDRSLPVGFQRGQDLNVEKAILVNRFIE
jgi:hypothetical protein